MHNDWAVQINVINSAAQSINRQSRGAKGRLSKMKKAELEKLYNKTMPGTEHGEHHDGPKTDHDGQQGDGYGLSLAPDPVKWS